MAGKLIDINTNFNELAGGAIAGAAINAASGMAGGGSGMVEKAWKGALVGAAVTALLPTGSNLYAKVMPPKKGAAATTATP